MKKTVLLLALILPVCALVAQLPAPVIPLDGNISGVEQYGISNSYTLTQDGTRNFAEVLTIGQGNGDSYVDQDGAWNTSTVVQWGDGNSVNVTQENENPTSGWNLNYSWIGQTGDGNEAEVYQKHQPLGDPDHLGPQVTYTYQTGDDNESVQQQEGLINLAIVAQHGDNGVAKQYQGTSDHEEGYAYGSLAIIDQLATSNLSKSEQHQVGSFNAAGIIQGSDESKAKQLQISDKNSHINNLLQTPNAAGIIQVEGIAKKGNEAYQVQYYDGTYVIGNWAGVYQRGGEHFSRQVQAGGKNASGVIQMGYNNHSDVTQFNGAEVASPW